MNSDIFDIGSRCESYRILAFHSRSPVSESYIARHTATSLPVVLTCSRFNHPGAERPSEAQFLETVAKLTRIIDAEIKSPRVLDGGVSDGVYWVVREHFSDSMILFDFLEGVEPKTNGLRRLRKAIDDQPGETMGALATLIGIEISYTLRVFAEFGLLHGGLDIHTTIALRGDGVPVVLNVGYRDLFGPQFFEVSGEVGACRSPEEKIGQGFDIRSEIYTLGAILLSMYVAANVLCCAGQPIASPKQCLDTATSTNRAKRFSSWVPFHDALQIFREQAIARGERAEAASRAVRPVTDVGGDGAPSGTRAARPKEAEGGDVSTRAGQTSLGSPTSRTRTVDESEIVATNRCPLPVSNGEAQDVEVFPASSASMVCIGSEPLDLSSSSAALSYTRERAASTPKNASFVAPELVVTSAPVVLKVARTVTEEVLPAAASEPTRPNDAAAPDSVPMAVDIEPAQSSAPIVVEEASVTVRVVGSLADPVKPAVHVALIPPEIDTPSGEVGLPALNAPSPNRLIPPCRTEQTSALSMRLRLLWAAAPAVAVFVGMLGLRVVLLLADRWHVALEQASQPRSVDYAPSSYDGAPNCEARPRVDWSAILRVSQPARKSEVK